MLTLQVDMRFPHSLAAIVLTVSLTSPTSAGEIVGYVPGNPTSQATYDRFTGGFPDDPVVNTSSLSVTAGLDVSGVGWRVNGNWGLTLITPQHFVSAAHVGLYAPGEQVRFLGADGVVRPYTVATDSNGAVRQTRLTTTFRNASGDLQTLPSDILVVTLADPIPVADQVTPIAIEAGVAGVGTPLLVYGQNPGYGSDTRQFGTNTLDGLNLVSFSNFVSEATVVARYDYTRTRPGDTALIGGDSGGPLLTRLEDTPVLLGTHYGVSGNLSNANQPYFSFSTYLPAYLDQLSAVVAGDVQSIAVVPVPEPAGIGFIAGALGMAWGIRRRKRR